MKKSILSFVFVLVLATVASAAPRFGIIGEQESGVGAFITDDMYNAQVTFSSESDDETVKTELTSIKAGANYKVALDSVTALTAGVSYQTVSGKLGNADARVLAINAINQLGGGTASQLEIDSLNTIAISAGFERALSSNIVLTTQADVYSQETLKVKGQSGETKTTRLFSNGRVGVAYLF